MATLAARYSLYAALPLFAAAVLLSEWSGDGRWFGLLAVAGPLIVAGGLAIALDWGGARAWFRTSISGQLTSPRTWGLSATAVGVAWTAIGLWALLT